MQKGDHVRRHGRVLALGQVTQYNGGVMVTDGCDPKADDTRSCHAAATTVAAVVYSHYIVFGPTFPVATEKFTVALFTVPCP